jgi:hypothetical protein
MAIQQVIHIPVPGPTPYNTLVYIGGTLQWTTGLEIPMGHLGGTRIRFNTPFKLIGFDPRVQIAFEHSTAVWMNAAGPQEHCMFQYAVDSVVDAAFDPHDGTFFVTIDVAFMVSKGLSANCIQIGLEPGSDPPTQVCTMYAVPFSLQISSYVLVYEPPPSEHPGGKGGIGQTHNRSGLVAELAKRRAPAQASRTTSQPTILSVRAGVTALAGPPSRCGCGPSIRTYRK